MTTKNGECLWQKMENTVNSPYFCSQKKPPASSLQWNWRECETEVGWVKNGPLLFPERWNPEIFALSESRWKWLVFFVKQSFCAIGWFGHLALVVPRDGELPELTKPWWSQRYCKPGSQPRSHHGREPFFGLLDSHFAGQQGYVKKRTMQSYFLMLPPVRLHRENF